MAAYLALRASHAVGQSLSDINHSNLHVTLRRSFYTTLYIQFESAVDRLSITGASQVSATDSRHLS